MSLVNTDQRVTSAQEDFNDAVDRKTHPVETNHPLFPATVVQCAHKVAMVSGGYTQSQQRGFHSLRLTWLQSLLSFQSARSRDQH